MIITEDNGTFMLKPLAQQCWSCPFLCRTLLEVTITVLNRTQNAQFNPVIIFSTNVVFTPGLVKPVFEKQPDLPEANVKNACTRSLEQHKMMPPNGFVQEHTSKWQGEDRQGGMRHVSQWPVAPQQTRRSDEQPVNRSKKLQHVLAVGPPKTRHDKQQNHSVGAVVGSKDLQELRCLHLSRFLRIVLCQIFFKDSTFTSIKVYV